MPLTLFQIDAFTQRPFSGNPAAVCLLPAPREDAWMRNLAREMNLSETAFLLKDFNEFNLRWFTPAVEVDLCGHATLASAHMLWEEGHLRAQETARFQTRSGLLTAVRRNSEIEMDFPSRPATPVEAPADLCSALGVEALFVGGNRMDFLVEVGDEETVRSLQPDFRRLRSLPVRGVIVTASSSTADYDFVSRFFAPGAGVDEDPVTGSAHCCLGPYWGKKLGKTEMAGYQASARGGRVGVRLEGERTFLTGQAVTVLRSQLLVD